VQNYEYLKHDVDKMLELDVEWHKLKDKTILITGATGLIGSMLCRILSLMSAGQNWNLNIIAMVRNRNKAEVMLEDVIKNNNITIVEQEMTVETDYIIHTACPTKSDFFLKQPVETIMTIIDGTNQILEMAKNQKSQSVVYLSSMEVYGEILVEKWLKEEDLGYLNPLLLRNCYPEGKRAAELLCISYAGEYQVPVKVARLAQTFGLGIPAEDNRVFAQFLKSVLTKKDIVLFTDGNAKRMYLDTIDAVSGILTILLKGQNGEIYNVAYEENYCSIKEMAELVISQFSQGELRLRIDKSKDVGQYPPPNMLKLDTTKLKNLGWKGQYDLINMYKRMRTTMIQE